MVVEYGHSRRVIVIESAGGRGVKKKIFVQEVFHGHRNPGYRRGWAGETENSRGLDVVDKVAAVNGEGDSGDEAGGFAGGEEDDGTVEVFGGAEAAAGGAVDDFLAAGGELAFVVVGVEEVAVLVADEEAGGDAVDADAVGGEFPGVAHGEVDDAGFGGGVGGYAAEGDVGGGGGYVDDGAGDVFLYPEAGEGLGGDEEAAEEVEADDFFKELYVGVDEGGFAAVSSGTVDEDGGGAGFLDDFGQAVFDGLFVGYVDGEAEDSVWGGAFFAELSDGLVNGDGFTAAPEYEAGTGLEEGFAEGGADGAGSASHEDELAAEVEGVVGPGCFGGLCHFSPVWGLFQNILLYTILKKSQMCRQNSSWRKCVDYRSTHLLEDSTIHRGRPGSQKVPPKVNRP